MILWKAPLKVYSNEYECCFSNVQQFQQTFVILLYTLALQGIGCTKILQDYNMPRVQLLWILVLWEGGQWCNCLSTGLHIKQSGFEPMVRVSALGCSLSK